MTSVAIKIDDSFEDDSSRALGLSHSVAAGKVRPLRPYRGGLRAAFERDVARINEVRRQIFDKRVRELVEQGMTIRQARERAQYEQDHPDVPKQIRDYESEHTRAIEHLMGVYRDVTGGSSSSKSKFRSRKTGTRLCKTCHLEGCECYRGPGRPRIENARTVQIGCKVSERVHDAMSVFRSADSRISPGAIVETVIATAIDCGITQPRDLLALLDGLRGHE